MSILLMNVSTNAMRYAVGYLYFTVNINARMFYVGQDTSERTFVIGTSFTCLDTVFIEVTGHFSHGIPCRIHPENALDDGRFFFMNRLANEFFLC